MPMLMLIALGLGLVGIVFNLAGSFQIWKGHANTGRAFIVNGLTFVMIGMILVVLGSDS